MSRQPEGSVRLLPVSRESGGQSTRGATVSWVAQVAKCTLVFNSVTWESLKAVQCRGGGGREPVGSSE